MDPSQAKLAWTSQTRVEVAPPRVRVAKCAGLYESMTCVVSTISLGLIDTKMQIHSVVSREGL